MSRRILSFFACLLLLSTCLSAQAAFNAPVIYSDVGSGSRTDIDVGDINGDGFPDVVVLDSSASSGIFRTWLNDGTGNFISSISYFDELAPQCLRLGDFDGDGDLDMLCGMGPGAVFVYENQPGGLVFGLPAWSSGFLGFQQPVRRLEIADMDGDGDLDFVAGGLVQTGQPERVGVWLNDGTGNFLQSDIFPSNIGGTTPISGLADLDLEDLDGDGLPEVITTSTASGVVTVHDNLGGGQFSAGTIRWNTPNAVWARGVTVADFNDDGFIDIAILTGAEVWIDYGLPSGSFSRTQMLTGGATLAAFEGLTGDFDGDGDVELLHSGPSNLTVGGFPFTGSFGLGYHDNPGNAVLLTAPQMLDSGNVKQARAVDLDGNGRLDIVSLTGPFIDLRVQMNQTTCVAPISGQQGLLTSVNGGPNDTSDKLFSAGDSISFTLDALGIPCNMGKPGSLFANLPPESGISAVTHLGGGNVFPDMTIVTPFSTPPGPAYMLADSLGFVANGITPVTGQPFIMGGAPLVITAMAFPPGTVIRLQAVFYDPVPTNFVTFGMVATNELRLTAQ